jgi:hypothetical protein
LFYDETSGQTQQWLTWGGSSRTATATLKSPDLYWYGKLFSRGGPESLLPPWRPVGSNDFSGDGKPDLLWRDDTTGAMQVWVIDGSTVVSKIPITAQDGGDALAADPWSVVGTNDFNADGRTDILVHDTSTGTSQVWFMNGASITSRGTVQVEDGGEAFVGDPWHVVGTGDFDLDGYNDILWHDESTGELQVWLLGAPIDPFTHEPIFVFGGLWVSRRVTVDTLDAGTAYPTAPWRVAGTNDFNLDGKLDLVLHEDDTGETQIWSMVGTSIASRSTVTSRDPWGRTRLFQDSPALLGAPWRIVNH